ncbi:AAA family ATPase [Klebsiella pneumoniae]|jgi:energy-coupling factor transporter ATP-binding protein EcfA2|uniref:AAA family ATPase n=1 Tax=Klebsiella pneumoniae TaxID=573 RepID=UPI00164BCBCD|nr:AAA family ATPase [Klebsiella pneumoniae]MBC5597826.1 AAA family ATPase [Klebsiella pneumoniae]MBL4334214.1 AAA family ATPase [Klebsiella pneumoniae]HBR2514173.1 AAA family ATPase [Klebsiella pneumoniae]HBR3304264.1 AAA family ATPase [Klebsiella pneumoniae]HBS7307183.1 AAA family ATPase [Klebsiella pneumoniae]
MIIGVFLRNIKSYRNLNYVPLTYSQAISGIIGLNGSGKSTILESFDVFFNGKNASQIRNNSSSNLSNIVPVFHLKKTEVETFLSELEGENKESFMTLLQSSNSKLREVLGDVSMSSSQYQYLIPLKLHLERLIEFNVIGDDDVLFSPGISLDGKGKVSYCSFENLGITEDESQELVVNYVKGFYRYLYIPRELNVSSFESLSSDNIYYLLEESLSGYIERIIPRTEFSKITRMLRGLLTSINTVIGDYQFKGRNSIERESLIKKDIFYGLFVKEFFANKILHYTPSGSTRNLSIENMSSGERQKALVDIIYNLLSVDNVQVVGVDEVLKIEKSDSSKLIIGIDEPDSSLHVAACFEQYQKIQDIAGVCCQTFMTSHWYGYIPVSQDAATVFVGAKDKEGATTFNSSFCLSNSNFVDDLKFIKRKRKDFSFPITIGTKGISDLTMSIMHAISGGVDCNWIVCEGASDRIYLDAYMKKVGEKVNVISVGGVDNLKSIYSIINAHYHEFKSSIKNKVIFISDTDANCVDDSGVTRAKNLSDHISWFRIVNKSSSDETSLLEVNDSLKAPVTTVEDSLNGKLYREALLKLHDELPSDVHHFISTSQPRNEFIPSVSLNFNIEIQRSLKEWFEHHLYGNKRKFDVAKAYVESMSTEEYAIPNWILKIQEKLTRK